MKELNSYCGGADLSYYCLSAEKRTKTFIEALQKKVKKGYVVLDAGAGTGILSLAAADAGAKKVYAIEQNKLIIPQLKRNIKNLGFANRIEVVEEDASKVVLPEKADMIICEMICAGLIDEPQIPVLNNLLNFLKKDGTVIPKSAEITVDLSYDDYFYYGYKLPYLHFEGSEWREIARARAKPITESKLFAKVDFRRMNPPLLSNELTLEALEDGYVNAIRVTTTTEVIKGLVLGECEAYCPVLVIPVEEFKIEKGETKALALSYKLGEGMLTIKQKIL